MDFRTLSRRELQALCKRNKIPANITNVAMADALAALPSVEGIEELLNCGSGVPESPMKEDVVSSEIPRTALRTSTRRKTVKDEAITTRTRRAAAARGTEESENRDLNVALTTPSLQSGRRRTAAASSACKKVDFLMTADDQKEDNDLDQEKNVIEKTPAVPKSQKRVVGASARKQTETRNNGAAEQRVYSTRRSVRLLEKNMESLSLGDDGKIDPITFHMSFDDMPNSSGPVKEDLELETESKQVDESESKLDEDLGVEIEDQDQETESEVKLSEEKPEILLDGPLKSSEEILVTTKSVDDSDTEVPPSNLDVKCFSEVEEANESSKDDDSVEISADEINDSDKFSLPTEDVDLGEVVHSSSIREESGMELESKQTESICELEHIIEEDFEEEVKLMNNSAEELSLPHENVEEETQVDDEVLSSEEESVMEVKDDDRDGYDYESDSTIEVAASGVDIEGDKKETEMEVKGLVQAEEDDTLINKSTNEFPENVAENLVDVKIQWQIEEAPPKDTNVDAIDSKSEIPNDIVQCKEALVESPTPSNNNGVQSLPSFGADQLALANQFPRPTVETKSSVKEQIISLLMEDSDAEEEEEKKEEEMRQTMEKNDMSLRQLKKMFKKKLQLSKKKMDNNNISTKVVGGGEGKVRTALQPVPENRMTVDELERRF